MLKKGLFLIMLAVTLCASASPVFDMPVVRLQPNGDTLRCFVSGDEFFHRLHDKNDYTIVQDVNTGYYVYAALSDGLLVPTHYVPGIDDPAEMGLNPGLKPCVKEMQRLHALWNVPDNGHAMAKTSGANHGTLNNVVVFIRFSDEAVCSTSPITVMDSMFNDSTANAVSMYNYFKHASYDGLHVKTYFFPTTSSDTIFSYQDSHPRAYYCPYSATNTDGYRTDDQRRLREFTLLQNAVNWINVNSPVPSSLNLDLDNDGYVDNICFVVSGTYTDWSDLLWPHKWSLYDRTVTINGKSVYTYNFQLAGAGSHYFSVSTFCHEMAHTLGAPDLYHYNQYEGVSPAGSWDLMCDNTTLPQQTNSLHKHVFLNWIDSIPEISDTGIYTMSSLGSGPNHAYKIASPMSHQWYILEYRNNTDTFDVTIPNRGLLIWRYNDMEEADNENFNATTVPHVLWLFRPNSSSDTVNGTPAAAAFGVNGRDHFDATSNPYPYLCNGMVDTSFGLQDIQISADFSTVSFRLTRPEEVLEEGCEPVRRFPLVEDFDDCDMGCWTMVSMNNGNLSNLGMCYSSTGNNAHSGDVQFRFSSWTSASNYNQYLISPLLQSSYPLHFKFYYRRSHNYVENFKVKYSTTGKEPQDFTTTVASVSVSSSGWHACDVLVPPTAKYVTINYCSSYRYNLYVDDLMLRDTLNGVNDTILRDTTYLNVHDTLMMIHYDTIRHWVYDSLYHYTDTIYSHLYDTVYWRISDTIYRDYYDTVYYEPEYVHLNVESFNLERGVVSGSGTFPVGTEVEIAAIPNRGCQFDTWSDGSMDNPRKVSLNADVSYIAYFVGDIWEGDSMPQSTIWHYHDTVYLHDTTWLHRTEEVHVTLHDTTWLEGRDTVRITIVDTVRLAETDHDTIWIDNYYQVDLDTISYFRLMAVSENDSMGRVAGSGVFPMGTTVELGAVAASGYKLLRWLSGSMENPRRVVVNGDMTYTALFEVDTSLGVNVVLDDRDFSVYVEGDDIVVRTNGRYGIVVFNEMGERVFDVPKPMSQSDVAGEVRVSGLRRGLYLVKVGEAPAKKVVLF